VIRGSCLCGGVRFELSEPFRRVSFCHCSLCRRHSGGPGLLSGRVRREAFRLVAGEGLVRVHTPEGGSAKAFCSACGSSLFGAAWPQGDEISVRLGALDDDPGMGVTYHQFVGSKAPWDTLPDDGRPRHEGPGPG
jgi:hypothetical protein